MAITKKVPPASRKIVPAQPIKPLVKSPSVPPANTPSPAATTTALTVSARSLLEQDAGAGMEGMTREDLAIPRLGILQALSPQCNKADSESYIDGAEPGMIHESVSNELFDGDPGILVVLVSYRRAHNEWITRQEGGGFIADHGPDPKILSETTKDKMNRSLLPNGHEIVPTAEYFSFLINEETGEITRALISMTKTQMRKAKKINTLASSLIVNTAKGPMQAPLFYRTFRLGTVPESNERGSWFGWAVKIDINTFDIMPPLGEQIYLQARQFKKDVTAGSVKVDTPKTEHSTTDHEGDDAPM